MGLTSKVPTGAAFHTDHPPAATHGLADDCPKCQRNAHVPNTLDEDTIQRIWRGEWHSKLDRQAYDRMYNAAILTQRIERSFGSERRTGVFDFGGTS